MLNKSVARRYAEAFFAIAQEKQAVDKFEEEIKMVTSVVEGHEELKNFMYHPLVPAKEKKDVAISLFKDKLSPETLNFICMVIDKRRERQLTGISEQFAALADEARNVIKAEITSAVPLDEGELSTLQSGLAKASGKVVRLEVKVDPSLIGGIRLRVGDRVVDASIAKQLALLKESLIKAKVS